ncbi:hypothetical protein MA5S0304_4186 [Mycobacteroides abscessus 5S-0304]|nr:hypothetical protein MA5S0304_4186 [Mycobacteroides abscessus 5S-0304]
MPLIASRLQVKRPPAGHGRPRRLQCLPRGSDGYSAAAGHRGRGFSRRCRQGGSDAPGLRTPGAGVAASTRNQHGGRARTGDAHRRFHSSRLLRDTAACQGHSLHRLTSAAN